MKKIIFILMAASLLCACSTTLKVRSSRTSVVPAAVSLSPMTSDLVVSETKAEGTFSVPKKKLVRTKRAMEQEAVAAALAPTKSDVLVNPTYTYTYKGKWLMAVSVSGYPAKYANFRKVNDEDAEIIYKLREPAAVIIKTEVEKKDK